MHAGARVSSPLWGLEVWGVMQNNQVRVMCVRWRGGCCERACACSVLCKMHADMCAWRGMPGAFARIRLLLVLPCACMCVGVCHVRVRACAFGRRYSMHVARCVSKIMCHIKRLTHSCAHCTAYLPQNGPYCMCPKKNRKNNLIHINNQPCCMCQT